MSERERTNRYIAAIRCEEERARGRREGLEFAAAVATIVLAVAALGWLWTH